ncbi:hypothetical protein T492DRAFT_69137 [Pavlovales sp. CCMP2436]|nr:hypothetical protein T492DRAFT_69137 [Pavlovales sp. CCMP2436]
MASRPRPPAPPTHDAPACGECGSAPAVLEDRSPNGLLYCARCWADVRARLAGSRTLAARNVCPVTHRARTRLRCCGNHPAELLALAVREAPRDALLRRDLLSNGAPRDLRPAGPRGEFYRGGAPPLETSATAGGSDALGVEGWDGLVAEGGAGNGSRACSAGGEQAASLGPSPMEIGPDPNSPALLDGRSLLLACRRCVEDGLVPDPDHAQSGPQLLQVRSCR